MTKYIDAEKLKRFVRELKERAKRNCCDSWGIVPDALEEVEGFIDSLQQEQLDIDEIKREWYNKGYLEDRKNAHVPARELGLSKSCDFQKEQSEVDLEKEIRFMWEKCNPTDEGMGVESTYMHIEAFDIIVRYFYELGLPKSCDMQEQPEVDLEKEINKFRTIFKNECDARIIGEIANHFAKWQKEQIMKEAVKAQFVSMDERTIKYDPIVSRRLKQHFHSGEWVSVIIIKEN